MSDRFTVLAVDDNPINVKLLSRTLTNNNYNVITAGTGEEAIQKAQNEQPDIILLDVLMPGMDGYETCKKLKSEKQTADIPVIFLSAKNETVDKARGLALGAVDYLTKPFDPVEITARLQTHLEARKAVADLHKLNDILLSELEDLRRQKNQNSKDAVFADFIKKILPDTTFSENSYFKLSGCVKGKQQPTTSTIFPVLNQEHHILYLLCAGFRNDFITAVVLLMLQKYAQGLLSADRYVTFNEQILMSMLEKILDAFSPDEYHAPFTLSMHYLHWRKKEYYSLTVHQSQPLILDSSCNIYHAEGFPLIVESKYAPIVKVRRYILPDHAAIVHYACGKENTRLAPGEDIMSVLRNSAYSIGEKTEKICQLLPEKEQDQLLAITKLL